VVLWALFILGALALAINSFVWPQLDLANRLKVRLKTHYLARAAIKRAMLEAAIDNTEEYDAPGDSWACNEKAFKEIPLGDDGTFSLEYKILPADGNGEEAGYGMTDEERKININTAPFEVLKGLFEIVAGASPNDAEDIAHCVMDRRDENDEPEKNGAEKDYYEYLEPPYRCKNGDFETLEELLLVKGVTKEIFDKVKDRATIYGSGPVNINTADEAVLRCLGLSEDAAAKVVHFRQGPDRMEGTKDDGVFTDPNNITAALAQKESMSGEETSKITHAISQGWLGICSENLRGTAVGRLSGKPLAGRVTFVFNRKDNIIAYWREE